MFLKNIHYLVFAILLISPTLVGANPPCNTLDRAECMDSTTCTLILPEPKKHYQCIPTTDPCEQGKKQSTLTKENCEAVEACRYNNANCYCPCVGYGQTNVPDKKKSDCNCDCGFGVPPMCESIHPISLDTPSTLKTSVQQNHVPILAK